MGEYYIVRILCCMICVYLLSCIESAKFLAASDCSIAC